MPTGGPDPETLLRELARSADLRPFRDLVESLRAYDRDHRGDLVRTMRAYFAANANASETAERLYLHRNSLPYRLERAAELTGLDLKDHRARLALQLGLLALAADEEGENG